MKKALSLFLLLAMLLSLPACADKQDINEITDESSIYFAAENREKMSISSVQHLPIFLLKDAEALSRFQSRFKEHITVSGRYNDGFFAENALVAIYVSDHVGLCEAQLPIIKDAYLTVHVKKIDDAKRTAGNLLEIPVKKANITSCTDINAYII